MTTPTAARPIPAPTSEAAYALILKMHEAERRWTAEYKRAHHELAKLQAERGPRLLDSNGDTESVKLDIRRAIGELRDARENAAATVDAARRQRAEAIPMLYQAQAAECEAKAAQIEAAAGAHEVRTRELFAQLQEHEGVAFVPDYLLAMAGWAAPGVAREAVRITIPKSRAMRDEAEPLRARAASLRARAVDRAGTVELLCPPGDPIEILERVLTDPMRIGPSIVDVEAWIDEARAYDAARRRPLAGQGADGADDPVVYLLAWRDGKIIEGESGARAAPGARSGVRDSHPIQPAGGPYR